MFGFFEKNDALLKHIADQLNALKNSALQLELENPWPEKRALEEAFNDTKKHLQKDVKHLETECRFMIATDGDLQSQTQQCIERLQEAQMRGQATSLAAMCVFALREWQVELSPDLHNMVLVGAVLGSVENTQPYHNNMHYKKVLLQAIRLISVHNDIYRDTGRVFDETEIALLLIAACIHDIGHDGLGNTLKGVHIQGRMEKLSFEYALPYLKMAGCSEPEILDRLLVMLLTTDVSPLDDPANPAGQMKAAYRFHFLGEKAKTHSLNLDVELISLEKDEKLVALCLLLHEADIATSAGLTYAVTQYETAILREEFCADQGRPSHIVDFLEQVCQQRFLSDAGQKLYASNMARIYARAKEDVKNGNQPFPKAEHTDFILGRLSTQDSVLDTIN